jgi:hypothetical protein
VELYLEGLPGVVEERTDVGREAQDSVCAPGEEERDEEEPGEEAEVLAGCDVVGRVVEVGAVEDGVVEDERLGEERCVGGALVLGVVEVGDAGGDLADLPAAEAGLEEAVAVLLLHPPELGVDAEGLGEGVRLLATDGVEVAHAGEAAVCLVQQRPELLGRPAVDAAAAAARALATALDLALLLRRRRHGDPLPSSLFVSLSPSSWGRVVASYSFSLSATILYWCHLAHSSPTQRQDIRWARPAHLA